ncbi:MAG: TldD/PmbA family protein [Candidatus Tenebribacter burtonii]|jgi:PmbA protein|nr:TldD/PmbA family protein [Candidatus Tenebribacter burtonii]
MYKKEFQTIFAYAKDKTDETEILLSAANSFSVKINEQNVESFNYADSKGIGVRIVKDGKVGYSYTEKFDDETFKLIVDEAIENAKYTEDDEVVIMENYPEITDNPNVYSESLDKVDVLDKIQLAQDLEKYAKEADKRVFNVPYAVYADGKSYSRIANSKGLDKEDTQNFAYAYVGALSAEKDDKRMGIEFHITRNFGEFDPKKMAEESVKKSTDLLNGKPAETGKYAVVFNNEMMATMLATFSGIFNAKSVQEGRSLLKGKIRQQIANEKVTIIDDGLHPNGFSTSAFDNEGYPTERTVLIENGVLRSFLHNTITARKDGVKSTGNGSRGYKGTLGISTSNFLIEAGEYKEADLFLKHNKTIEIVSLQGMHSGANAISGDFSLGAQGFLWEHGKRKHSLKPFTVSGNFLQMLNGVEAIADNFKFDMSSNGASSILINELNISG